MRSFRRAITRTLHDVAAIVSARGGTRRLSHPASHRASRPYRRPQSSSDARRRRWPGSKRRRSYRRALRLEPSRGAVRLSHIASLRGWPHLRLWPPVEERQRYRELQGAFTAKNMQPDEQLDSQNQLRHLQVLPQAARLRLCSCLWQRTWARDRPSTLARLPTRWAGPMREPAM